MATNTIIEQQQLRGSQDDDLLQRVATVYVGVDEYRVFAPPKAIGDSLQWIGHFRVHQPNTDGIATGEVLVQGTNRIRIINLVKEELEKANTNASSSGRSGNRKTKLRELLDDLSHLHLCGPSDDPDAHT